jgi:hypothetical protein
MSVSCSLIEIGTGMLKQLCVNGWEGGEYLYCGDCEKMRAGVLKGSFFVCENFKEMKEWRWWVC